MLNKVQSTAHQTIQFGVYTALISKASANIDLQVYLIFLKLKS
jgi:hypothetical protein